jgi:prepilin-type N-terminal cleavage/methylation domain-containing protein
MNIIRKDKQQLVQRAIKGFTIIELLISTVVFSMVLLVVAVGVMQFNRAYYGGITQSNTQNVARAILENVSQAIQFSGNAVTANDGNSNTPGSTYYFCAGGTQYRYLLGWQLSDNPSAALHQTYHALVIDNPNGGCDNAGGIASINTASVSGTELLGVNMRLSHLSVTQVSGRPNMYKVEVRVVYGSDDLLKSPSNGGPTAPDVACQTGAGSQFCAMSDLTTVVQKRVD